MCGAWLSDFLPERSGERGQGVGDSTNIASLEGRRGCRARRSYPGGSGRPGPLRHPASSGSSPAQATERHRRGVSDCALGSTDRDISGSNPSRSATNQAFEITYEVDFKWIEFSPLSRGLWRRHFRLASQRRFSRPFSAVLTAKSQSRILVVRASLTAWSPARRHASPNLEQVRGWTRSANPSAAR